MGKRIETEIVERFAKGDDKAFETIYEFYKSSVYVFSLSLLKNQADAEEIVQDTFMKVYQKIHTLKELKTFHAWLFTITYNTAMKLYHKKKKQFTPDDENYMETLVATKGDPKEKYVNKEVIDVIKEELSKLPNKFLIVAELRFFDDLTTKEIAGILNIPEGTVKNRLNRIRNSIKPGLIKKGFNPNHYLGVAGIPIFYEVFLQYANNAPNLAMPVVNSGAALAITTQLTKTSSKLLTNVGISVMTTAVVGGGYMFYETQIQKPVIAISDVQYTADEYTSIGEPVQVVVNQSLSNENIRISNSDGDIEYLIQDDKIIFQAPKNDTYVIHIDEYEESIQINNIDDITPKMQDVSYLKDAVKLKVEDYESGIDYQNSTYEYNGNTYIFPSDGIIQTNQEGNIYVYLSDLVGNNSEYEITITKENTDEKSNDNN